MVAAKVEWMSASSGVEPPIARLCRDWRYIIILYYRDVPTDCNKQRRQHWMGIGVDGSLGRGWRRTSWKRRFSSFSHSSIVAGSCPTLTLLAPLALLVSFALLMLMGPCGHVMPATGWPQEWIATGEQPRNKMVTDNDSGW